MALTPEEESELAMLEADLGTALSPEEERELAQLEQELGPTVATKPEPKPEPIKTERFYPNIDQSDASQLLNSGAFREPRRTLEEQSDRALSAMDPTIAAGPELEKQKREYEVPRLAELLAETIQIPLSEVDVTTGMSAGDRFQTGRMKNFEDKIKYYTDKYGNDGGDVRNIFIADKPRIVVSHPTATNGKYVLADEHGSSFRDILDASRDIALGSGELAGSLLTMKLTGGASAYPLMRGALGAGSGNAVTNFLNESTYESANEAEYQILKDLGMSAKEGGKASAIDLGIGGIAKYGIKALKDFRDPSYSDEVSRNITDSIARLEKNYGINFPETAATRAGSEKAFERQAKLLGQVPSGVLTRKAERARDTIYALKQAMFGGKPTSYDTLYTNWVKSQRDQYNALLNSVQGLDPILARQLSDLAQNRINRLNVGSAATMTRDVSGKKIRSALQSEYNLRKNTVDQLYKDIYTVADSRGIQVSAADASDRILSAINRMDVPVDLQDEVLNVFLTPGARQLRREGVALGKQAQVPSGIVSDKKARGFILMQEGDAVQPLSLKQIDDRRKSLRKVIERMGKRGEDTSQIMKVQDELDGIMKDAVERGGDDLKKAHANAVRYFKDNIRTFRSTGLKNSLVLDDAGEYLIDSQQLAAKFFSSDRPLGNIRELKKAIGKTNPEAMQSLREGYLNHILGDALRSDGTISYAKLKNLSYNKDVAKEILGENQAQAMKALGDIMDASSLITKTVDPEDLRRLLSAKTPQDVRKIAENVELKVARQAVLERGSGKRLIKLIQDGSIDFQSPEAFLKEFRNLNATQAMLVMDKIPDDLTRQAFRAKILQDIFDMAAEGGSALQKTSKKFKRAGMWDPHRLESKQVMGNKKYREMLEAVLGKNTVRDVFNLNNALKGYMRANVAVTPLVTGGVRGQTGQTGPSTVVEVVRVPIDAISNRLMSLVASSGSAGRLIADSKNIDEMISNMIPVIMSTDNGIDLLFNEASEYPPLEAYLSEYFSGQ